MNRIKVSKLCPLKMVVVTAAPPVASVQVEDSITVQTVAAMAGPVPMHVPAMAINVLEVAADKTYFTNFRQVDRADLDGMSMEAIDHASLSKPYGLHGPGSRNRSKYRPGNNLKLRANTTRSPGY